MNFRFLIFDFRWIAGCVLLACSPCIGEETSPPPSDSPTQTESLSPDETLSAPDIGDSNSENTPAPYSQEITEKTVAAKPKKTGPPKRYGDCSGKVWIGQRTVTKRHAGWGWVKREGNDWDSAKWVMLEENPGIIHAPGRYYDRPTDDNMMQYRLYGHFADYKGYEPNVDALVPVFVLQGVEVVGQGAPITRKPPTIRSAEKPRISSANRGPSMMRHLMRR